MFSDKIFLAAFLISLFAHGAMLVQHPNLNFLPVNDKPEKMEVKYLDKPKAAEEFIRYKQIEQAKAEPFLKFPPIITASKKAPPQFINNEVFSPQKRSAAKDSFFVRPALEKPDIIAVKKKITFPALDIEKSNNPTYISYYQTVREKIRRAAYQNYTRTETGEVFVTFIISNNGFIRESIIVEEKSSGSAYLKEIALRSIKDASPFPNFPEDLSYPQLSFNIVVSFEVE